MVSFVSSTMTSLIPINVPLVDPRPLDPENSVMTPEWYERQGLIDQQFLTADQRMDLEQMQLDYDEQQYPYRFGS